MNTSYLSTAPIARDFMFLDLSSHDAKLVNLPNCRAVVKNETPTYEVAAYLISETLGWNLVPATVLREYKGKKHSFQLFIEGVETAQDVMDREHSDETEPEDSIFSEGKVEAQMAKMWLLDVIIDNQDRHEFNYLIDASERKVWAIDHGGERWVFTHDGFIPEGTVFEIYTKYPELHNDVVRLYNNDPKELKELLGVSYYYYRERLKAIIKFHESMDLKKD